MLPSFRDFMLAVPTRRRTLSPDSYLVGYLSSVQLWDLFLSEAFPSMLSFHHISYPLWLCEYVNPSPTQWLSHIYCPHTHQPWDCKLWEDLSSLQLFPALKNVFRCVAGAVWVLGVWAQELADHWAWGRGPARDLRKPKAVALQLRPSLEVHVISATTACHSIATVDFKFPGEDKCKNIRTLKV